MVSGGALALPAFQGPPTQRVKGKCERDRERESESYREKKSEGAIERERERERERVIESRRPLEDMKMTNVNKISLTVKIIWSDITLSNDFDYYRQHYSHMMCRTIIKISQIKSK